MPTPPRSALVTYKVEIIIFISIAIFFGIAALAIGIPSLVIAIQERDKTQVAECDVDSDCTSFDGNPCIETTCVAHECQMALIDGADCSSTSQCSDGYSCSESCLCEVITIDSSTWLLYTPTVQNDSNIGLDTIDFTDGVYYRVVNGFLEMEFYAIVTDAIDGSVVKELVINTPDDIFLNTTFNGAGIFTCATTVQYSDSSTVWKGTGSSGVFSNNSINFFIFANQVPSGSSTIPHDCGGSFIGPVL